jgi:hypothetical protein
MKAELEQTLANIRRLKAIAAEFEEMAFGYREKADQLLREADRIRVAATRMSSDLESA